MSSNRLVPIVLVLLLVMLHLQLWSGRGSIPEVQMMRQSIADQKHQNAQAQRVNERLASEVRDLRDGLDMVEEKARAELGMVRPNEIYVQITR